jgi:hypothetical protein
MSEKLFKYFLEIFIVLAWFGRWCVLKYLLCTWSFWYSSDGGLRIDVFHNNLPESSPSLEFLIRG